MAKIVVSGIAHAIADDPRSDQIIQDAESLQPLHGVYSDDLVLNDLDLPGLEEIVVGGGRLRFVYAPQDKGLRITTDFDVTRDLTQQERELLVEQTISQWSDGAGSGAFSNPSFQVLSTSLAMAIQNSGEDISDYGDTFLDAYPMVDDQQVRVEFDPDGSADDELIADLASAANAGDDEALIALGARYEGGDGVPKDLPQALALFQAAAELGNPLAMVLAGFMMQKGEGCEEDKAAAARLFRQAADLDFPTGMHALGECYAEGYGVPVDGPRSVELYRQGADLGDPGCTAELADCLEFGKGIDIDLEAALECYQAASDAGFDAVDPALQRVKQQLGRA